MTQPYYATPPKGSTVRQIFLGSSDNYYFTLVILSANPGSHYKGYDSTFVYKIDIQTNRLIERSLMAASYYHKIDQDNWKRTVLITNSSIDLSKYMIENDVHFSWSSGFFPSKEVFIDVNGLYLIKDKEKVIKLLSPDEFMNISGITTLTNIRFKDSYKCHFSTLLFPQSPSYYFFKFQYTGPGGYEKQFFVPLSEKTVREKIKQSGKK
jgi:hypothetical protein